MTPTEPSREELEATIASLRDEIARLKEEIRQIRRETNEAPPHYLQRLGRGGRGGRRTREVIDRGEV